MHCSNHSGNTLLVLACMYGHTYVVKHLVEEHEYDVKHEGFSALHCACLCLKPPLRNDNNQDVVNIWWKRRELIRTLVKESYQYCKFSQNET